FAAMLTSEGRINGEQFLQPETIRLFTTPVNKAQHTRALGWDTRSLEGYSSAGQYFGPNSFGHTGFTGTSIWTDPGQDLYVILLTNRVYPTRDNRGHIPVRPALADIAYQAIQGDAELLLPSRDR
ncbi:MAG TPA: serine hydrolase, partial [Rhodothermales bacterium]|nr:serine hydrolase [Rhodothermales bacterium]